MNGYYQGPDVAAVVKGLREAGFDDAFVLAYIAEEQRRRDTARREALASTKAAVAGMARAFQDVAASIREQLRPLAEVVAAAHRADPLREFDELNAAGRSYPGPTYLEVSPVSDYGHTVAKMRYVLRDAVTNETIKETQV